MRSRAPGKIVSTGASTRDKVMPMTDWHGRWQEGRIPFHRAEVNPDLLAYAESFLADGPHRVFVPLCGKSVDIKWLAERGHEVIGVELVERAVAEWHSDNNVTASVANDGDLRVHKSPGVTLYQGDFFALTPAQVRADRVWDRAALIALPEPQRREYVAHLLPLLTDNWQLLQSTIEYDRSVMDGPPFSVDQNEIRSLYANHHIETLLHTDVIAEAQRWRDRGHSFWIQGAYLISSTR